MMGSVMRNLERLSLVAIVWTLATMMRWTVVDGYYSCSYQPTAWKNAHATFYGDESAQETMGGACGYGNLYANGYGTETAALSTVLFNNGKSCGQCFQLKCVNSTWCYPGSPAVTVTATNFCPPNWYQPTDAGGWCNPPRTHFDLSKPVFMKFAQWTAGIVPVMYRRVPCVRNGGIRFAFQGNNYWLLVFVMNVGGGGDVSDMWVKGSKMGTWVSMTRNWGASFQAFAQLGAQSLSFKIKSASTGQTIIADNVAPSYWSTGQTYKSYANFH